MFPSGPRTPILRPGSELWSSTVTVPVRFMVILELIYENNKDSVTQNNQPVNEVHQQTN